MAVPSDKTIQRIFPKLGKEGAKEIRARMQRAGGGADAEQAMKFVNEKLGRYGVEVVNGPHFRRGYWANVVLAYVNFGDPYDATIGYEPEYGFDGRFIVLPGGWGSWVEWYERKHGEVL